MIQVLGILLTIVAAAGLAILLEWLCLGHYWLKCKFRAAHARLRGRPSAHARTEEPDEHEEEKYI